MADDFIVDLKGYILREHRFPRDAWCDPDDVQAALDEIERLRAALREIEECNQDPRLSRQSCVEQLQSMARAALAGEASDDAAT